MAFDISQATQCNRCGSWLPIR